MNFIYRYAKKLYTAGKFKLAGDVVDMFSRKQKNRKEHNQRVLDEMRKEDRDEAILDQHKVDRLLMSPDNLALTYPERGAPGRRYEVSVLYPSFDDKGAPYFDGEAGVEESLSVTSEELEGLKEEESQGYIKILNVDAKLPKK